MKIFPLRLEPNQDLKENLISFVNLNNIQAGFIITAVGSLKKANLRFSTQNFSQVFNEFFEIVSLVGTVSVNGVHLHIAVSDRKGNTLGGHLMTGCLIYTTAEIIIGESEDFVFLREIDDKTGFKELKIQSRSSVGAGSPINLQHTNNLDEPAQPTNNLDEPTHLASNQISTPIRFV